MAFTVGNIAGKDGAGTAIGGGLLAADIAGGGVGPWFLYHSLVDGVAGSNKLNITAANALKVDGSAVTQPVSNAGTFAVQATIAAGATEVVAVAEAYGWRLGRVVDPFGHHWEIGHPLSA